MSLISKNWWREAKLRFKNKSHDFFKRMKPTILILIALGPAGEAAILTLESKNLYVPGLLNYVCVGLTFLGVGMAVTAKLTTQNTELDEVSRKPKEPEI